MGVNFFVFKSWLAIRLRSGAFSHSTYLYTPPAPEDINNDRSVNMAKTITLSIRLSLRERVPLEEHLGTFLHTQILECADAVVGAVAGDGGGCGG